jgi:hypothetical protein
MNKVLIRPCLGIVIFSFTIVVLGTNPDFHSNLAKGEKPAVCDSGDKLVNSIESRICGVPTTNQNATNVATKLTK